MKNRNRAIASTLLTASLCAAVSTASTNTALAATMVTDKSNVDLSVDAEAELAATPAVFAAAAAGAAAAFALKATYDVGVAAGEWIARKLVGSAAMESTLSVAEMEASAEVLLD